MLIDYFLERTLDGLPNTHKHEENDARRRTENATGTRRDWRKVHVASLNDVARTYLDVHLPLSLSPPRLHYSLEQHRGP
jgi:hypothetical protein